MVPAPVAALEQVLDKMDEEISIEPVENEKIDMSLDDDELETDADAEVAEEADVDADADDSADDAEE
jgi:hypothetical protein